MGSTQKERRNLMDEEEREGGEPIETPFGGESESGTEPAEEPRREEPEALPEADTVAEPREGEIGSEEGGETEPEPKTEPKSEGRTFTLVEVNRMMGKTRAEAREKARREVLEEMMEKYGIEDEGKLDEMFGNSERYDELKGRQSGMENDIREKDAEIALLRSGINPDRFDDVKAWCQYNGYEINPVSIEKGLGTHPEWADYDFAEEDDEGYPEEEQVSVVRKLGSAPKRKAEEGESDDMKARRLFGI